MVRQYNADRLFIEKLRKENSLRILDEFAGGRRGGGSNGATNRFAEEWHQCMRVSSCTLQFAGELHRGITQLRPACEGVAGNAGDLILNHFGVREKVETRKEILSRGKCRKTC